MSAFTAINLDKLPFVPAIPEKDFETLLAEIKAEVLARAPELEAALALESELATKLCEAFAYRLLILRQEINEAARGNMLAYATGPALDQLAALLGVTRQVIQDADPDAIPPAPEVLEDDTRLRTRTQLALEGFSTAGPRGSYIFWGLSASPGVKDVSVASPAPGEVVVTVLSRLDDGSSDAALIDTVSSTLNDEDVRPLTDQVTVQAATILPYEVEAILTLYNGPDESLVVAEAQEAIDAYVVEHHRLGHDITISGVHAALHQTGVQNVALIQPAAHIEVDDHQAAYCTGITLTVGGRDV
ncbi:baseplate J/gp47 family protein [uncultured Ruegeria sp.]|uniref:baseplate assembly protein n=1 Tax=uncultured Ruegeria sp. TaxID=259304 RepID=UPI00263A2E1F|nr:baseplate J/gp47 family protein [uncultured Ruegeria sp.]